ncbi:MAG: OmpH family outer membrane protein, partial [Holosporaceae bacterium]|nr:OmpH family outer membrane protein [Holosporaceae bacterium]
SIAIIDLKKILSESKAGKNIEKQIEKYNNDSKKDLEDLESQLKLLDNKKKKSEEDSRKIEELQVILYEMVRSKKYQIAEAYSKAISVLDKEMRGVIEKICENREIDAVVNGEAVVFTNKCPDITDEAIKMLDKSCREIKVELTEQK